MLSPEFHSLSALLSLEGGEIGSSLCLGEHRYFCSIFMVLASLALLPRRPIRLRPSLLSFIRPSCIQARRVSKVEDF
jgi:hypothetical protein